RGFWPAGSYLLMLGAALAVGTVTGPLIERGLLRWIYDREPVIQLLATYSLFLILEDLIKLIWGVNPYFAYRPAWLLGQVWIGGIPYPAYSLLLLGVALLAGGFIAWFLRGTRTGRLVVAMIHDPEICTALGVNVPRLFPITFTMGAILAALGGAFTAPMLSVVPGISVEVIVLAFAVVVIGGLGSLEGSAVGALLVGLVRSIMVHQRPELELFTVYLVMALVLLLRPQGLFAREEVRRV
ncbi:MAG: branched-chain amino acid ABC transporter permease, partial [Thermoflexus sp.]